jgi:hypothetical protein
VGKNHENENSIPEYEGCGSRIGHLKYASLVQNPFIKAVCSREICLLVLAFLKFGLKRPLFITVILTLQNSLNIAFRILRQTVAKLLGTDVLKC